MTSGVAGGGRPEQNRPSHRDRGGVQAPDQRERAQV